jgi:NADH-quinone oxidoreductase subunit J
MEKLFFLLFALVAVAFALGVVAARNPVHSALSLIACFVQIAALFILLRAPFVAAVQIFVYVGTIMVLFIFVIMMLDIRKAFMERFVPGSPLPALLVALLLGGFMLFMLLGSDKLSLLSPPEEISLAGTTHELGIALFTRYLLPFEVVSVILLVALIGAIFLATKESGKEQKSREDPEGSDKMLNGPAADKEVSR